jgi:hypothetical protein
MLRGGWLWSLGLILWAQTGQNIRLVIYDRETEEPLVGATVRWSGGGTYTDTLGQALVPRPTGRDTLRLEVRYLGYTPYELVVGRGSPAIIRIGLVGEGVQTESVVITARSENRTEVALLSALQAMPQVATGLSAQTLERLPDRTTAQAMSRITGLSLNDGRFLVIRGMYERYNTILLDGLMAPSTEPESRTFDLEVLPTGLVSQILVYKTAHAAYPADFGGGIVMLRLREPSEKPKTTLQLRTAYLLGTTFREGLSGPTYSQDYYAGVAPERTLPAGFPENFTSLSTPEAQRWMQALSQPYQLRTRSSLPPQTSLTFTTTQPLGKRLWSLSTLSYGRNFQNLTVQRYRYERRYDQPGQNPLLFAFEDQQTTQAYRLTLAQRLSFWPAPRHRIDLTALLLRLAEEETIIRTGYSYYQRADALFRNYSLQYLSRTIGLLQMGGMHRISEETSITWQGGYTFSRREEPDFQRIRTVKEPGDSLFRIIIPPGATTFDAARFYSTLQQNGVSLTTQLQTTLGGIQWQTGLQGDFRKRTFQARWFSYTLPPAAGNFLQSWSGTPVNQAFSPEYLPNFRLREGTNPTDRYTAEQAFAAAFLSGEKSLARWRLQAGLRYEYSYQRLNSATATASIDQFTPFPMLLPFTHIGYHLTEKHRLRLAYARSLNRPELRELAPFTYYNFALTVDQAGNATLIPATLHHVDGRYDFSPSLDQLVSIGAFYKYIRRPIENYILRGADNPILQFGQAASAYLVGVEAEVRLRLLKRLDVISNLALIYSQVDMGDRVRGLAGESQARYRPLYGQAPYIANLILTYTSPSQAWQITGALQQIGPRIFWVGDNLNPTVYEMPRLVNDLTIRRKLGRWYVQLQARDMLNQPFVYRQDTNLNGRIEKNEDIVIRYVRGSEWSVQVGVEW